MEIIYRTLTVDDAEAVRDIEVSVFPREAWSLEVLRVEIGGRWSHYLGAFRADELIGYGGVKGGVEGDLMTLAVRDEERGRGVGRHLVEGLLARAKDSGMEEVFLEVRVSNLPARSLYTGLGFRDLGLIRDYYRAPLEDAVRMGIKL
ncbi:ribosomal protein S18-alanine N-acetyltransferase [Actinomyces minihominis]|uniref:ribosomal protein S18-alanine N-acetyltransferase n=1 Tax=Actinomyces minihominis TaxID=2002838 RepID=UPI000C074EF6|nr:ribosomal protein S18-alanine N-acetyltransferase [Actinomyces minihominis]